MTEREDAAQWDKHKRELRWRALAEDGPIFGLTGPEQAEFDRLEREFNPKENGQ